MLNNKNLILNKDTSLKEALKIIEKGSLKIAFVLSNDHTIFGSISDGDIRRWIISNGSISVSCR